VTDQCSCKKHEPMTEAEKKSALMGFLTLMLLLGLVVTSVLLFFGLSPFFPNMFLVGLIVQFIYYAMKAHKENKK